MNTFPEMDFNPFNPLEYEYKINYINNYQYRLDKKDKNIDIY